MPDIVHRASIPSAVIPDMCYRESIFIFFADGSPLPTGGDDGGKMDPC